jgi:hypothetical protein
MTNNVHPIWSPRDSIDTAHQFHLELHNAERGVPERKSRLFSVSRERKARRMDALAVALLVVTLTILGWLFATVYAPAAKADDWTVVYAYAATYGGAVCETLDSYPSFGGIYGIADAITEDGLTYYQAGQVIAVSVMEICPRHTALVRSFAASSAGSHA